MVEKCWRIPEAEKLKNERNQTEEDLEKFKIIADTATYGLAITNPEGEFVYVNESYARMHQYTSEELIGKHFSVLYDEEQFKVAERLKNRAAHVGSFVTEEVWHKRKDGAVFPTLMTGHTVKDDRGKILHFTATTFDITERKQTEEALRREKEFSQGLIASMQDGLFVLDSDGVHIDVNPAFCKMTGFSRRELIGVGIPHPYWPPEHYEEIGRAYRKGLAGESENFELNFMRKNGERFPVIVSSSRLKDGQGNIISYFATVKDITEHKKLDQLKDEFISLVSHELRSQLTIIIGALNTALSEEKHLTRDEMRRLLQDASCEAESLSRLVGNLLELSRSQAKCLTLFAEPVDIRNVVKNVVKQITQWNTSHQIVVDFPRKLPSVFADQLRLERVLYNLLENAIKYSPQVGEIRVFAKPESRHLVIGVSDQGIGISVSDQAKLFKLFQRLEDPRVEGVKGAGLGLMVCQRLVEAHGGRIWVESKPGQGSTFFFTLPLIAKEHDIPESGSASYARRS